MSPIWVFYRGPNWSEASASSKGRRNQCPARPESGKRPDCRDAAQGQPECRPENSNSSTRTSGDASLDRETAQT